MKHVACYITVASALLLCAACGDHHGPSSQSQTHWLHTCDVDAECGSELACECGRCVAPCGADDRCDVAGLDLECQARSSGAVQALCGAAEAKPLCLEPCDGQCARGQRCVAGACIAAGSSGSAGASGGDGGRGGQSGGSGTGGTLAGGAAGADVLCIQFDQNCDIENDQCCFNSHCEQTGCTDANPPNCFGVCRAGASGGKVDPNTLPVTCTADSPHFAAFDRECKLPSDCVIGERNFGCCGTRFMGIRASVAEAFAESSMMCTTPPCECVADPITFTVADDGTTAEGGLVPYVDCVAGLCQTTMGPPTATQCGDMLCDTATEICVENQAFSSLFECKPVPPACSSDRTCQCAQSACEPPYSACSDQGQGPNHLACVCLQCAE